MFIYIYCIRVYIGRGLAMPGAKFRVLRGLQRTQCRPSSDTLSKKQFRSGAAS